MSACLLLDRHHALTTGCFLQTRADGVIHLVDIADLAPLTIALGVRRNAEELGHLLNTICI